MNYAADVRRILPILAVVSKSREQAATIARQVSCRSPQKVLDNLFEGRHNYPYTQVGDGERRPMPKNSDDKTKSLRRRGCLNPDPNRVTDELFDSNEFFDPQDLVQVKYEMLRRVRAEQHTVSRTAVDFGSSRPSFYEAQRHFDQDGLAGLVPKKRGPRADHKLTQRSSMCWSRLGSRIRTKESLRTSIEHPAPSEVLAKMRRLRRRRRRDSLDSQSMKG